MNENINIWIYFFLPNYLPYIISDYFRTTLLQNYIYMFREPIIGFWLNINRVMHLDDKIIELTKSI